MTDIIGNQIIIMADDDQDDQFLVEEAWLELGLEADLKFVSDGEELLETLLHGNQEPQQLPSLILLDLNMPRMDGKKALKEIKSNAQLCKIPVVILTTSKDTEDIQHCYQLGAAGFITKPSTYNGIVEVIQTFDRYWFHTVTLPGREKNGQ